MGKVLPGLLLALAIAVVPGSAYSEEQAEKNVLIVSSLNYSMPFYSHYIAGIREVCDRFHPGRVTLFEEFMDMVRFGTTRYMSLLPDYYKAKYESKHLDAIIDATQFISPIFPGVPTMATLRTSGLFDLDGCIELIVHLQPAVRKLFIVTGSHPFDQGFAGLIRKTGKNFPGLEFICLPNDSYEELIAAVRSLPPNSAIVFMSFLTDKKGCTFVPAEVCRGVCQAANCPVYGMVTIMMGNGIVGGPLFDHHRFGMRMGEELLRLLYGEQVIHEPAETEVVKQVDEREMIRWGLSERNLPSGYEVVNRVPSLWRDHKSKVVALFLFIFLESALIFSLLVQRRRKKIAEREAREREAQLVHADKMISLGTMAAGIGHEINNPNNFILMNASLQELAWKEMVEKVDWWVEENGDFLIGNMPYSLVRERIPGSLRCVVEGAERIRTIVRDMKTFVNQSSEGMKEKIDINAILRTSINLLSNKLKKSTKNLTIEYGEGIPPAEGNAQRLGQVVINLLLNAAEALPNSDKALEIKTRYDRGRRKIILEVKDEGIGIDPENMKRVFDPFFTTKRERGGTGLGLSISMNIVKAHGGEILITSKPGRGTTAAIELPAGDSSIGRM